MQGNVFLPGNRVPVDFNMFKKSPGVFMSDNGITMEEMDRPGVRSISQDLIYLRSLDSAHYSKKIANTINDKHMNHNDIKIIIKHIVYIEKNPFQQLLALQIAITKFACPSLSADDLKSLSNHIDRINFPDKPADDGCIIS